MAGHKNHKDSHSNSPSPGKARKILEHGSVHGKPLSPKQKRFMHFIEGGGTPTRKANAN
jgi:hypothetical protein